MCILYTHSHNVTERRENFNPDAAIDEWHNIGLRVRRLTKNDEIKSILETTIIQLHNLNKCEIWTKHI